MEPTSSITDNSDNFNKSTPKIIASFLLIVGLFLSAFLLYKYYVSTVEVLSPEDKKALEETRMQSEAVFSPSAYKEYLATVDKNLEVDTISQNTRNILLFKKALMMLDSQETSEKVREDLRNQGGAILKSLYDLPATDNEALELKDKVTAQYLMYFNQLFFMPSNTKFLPEKYSKSYVEITTRDNRPQDGTSTYTMLAFQAHSALSEDLYTDFLKNDKTFISNRIYLLGSYLDAYFDKMGEIEKSEILRRLHEDLLLYPRTQNVLFVDQRHTQLNADFYYAYGYDAYMRNIGDAAGFTSEQVGVNYEKARSNVDTTKGFAETNATMGQYIGAYYLSYLTGLQKTDSSKINEVIKEISSYAENKNSANVMGYFYRALGRRGADSPLHASLAELNRKNKNFAAYLNTIGVTLK